MATMQPFPGLEHQPFTEGDGPATAVLVHGFPGTPAEVRPLAAALVAVGWRVRAPLLPGFGADWGTLRERRWTEWRDAAALELENAAASGGPVMAVGFSMGGALIVAALGAGAPADAAVLIAPFTRFDDRRTLLLPLLRHVVRDLRPYERADLDDPSLRHELSERLGDVDLDDPATRDRVRNEVSIPTAALLEAVRAGRHAWRAAPRLPARPTLVAQGLHDTTVTPQATVALLRRLRGAPRRLMLEGADHRVLSPGAPGHDELLRALQRFGHEQLGRLG
jgi:carboxylesterase